VKDVEIVFEAKGLLVPAHRLFQRLHRVAAFVLVSVANPDPERDLAPGARPKAVAHRDEIAGDKREEVGRLGVGVDPFRPVPSAGSRYSSAPSFRPSSAMPTSSTSSPSSLSSADALPAFGSRCRVICEWTRVSSSPSSKTRSTASTRNSGGR